MRRLGPGSWVLVFVVGLGLFAAALEGTARRVQAVRVQRCQDEATKYQTAHPEFKGTILCVYR